MNTLRNPRRLTSRDVIAVLIALFAASIARSSLDVFLENRAAHVTYVVAVLIVAWSYGLWTALLTGILGAGAAVFLFVPPRFSFAMPAVDDQVALALNLLVELVGALSIEMLRRISRENAELYRLARAADIRKDEFLAMVSHELRNPLVALQNAAFLLTREQPSEHERRPMCELVERQVRTLVRLVDDLLDVARITQGKIELQKGEIELTKIVEAALEIVQPIVSEKKMNLSVSAPSSVELTGDPIRLVQVFANLLNNAAKYSNTGGNIWLTIESTGTEAVVRVRDDGIGIPERSLSKIFGLFEQAADAPTMRRGGLGVGLTIVRTLVELHQGTIEARSPGVGLGSEFTVRLPIERFPATEKFVTRSLNPQASDATGHRVLIVDDNVSSANSMAMLLRFLGYEVQISYNAFAALELARTFRPEIVMADIGLPQMNGLEFAKQLRLIPGFGKILLLAVTGYGHAGIREAAREAGFDRHLLKPVDPKELEELLSSFV